MFRFFENLVDPYVDYEERNVPPRKLWPFLWDYAQPFKRLFGWATFLSVVVAAVEVGLIWYMGRLVDILSSAAPATVWQEHGPEFVLAALFILFLRPAIQTLDVLILNNSLLPNFGTLIRWRAHRTCCASPSAGSRTISPAVSPTGSCRRPPPRARRCSRSSTRSPSRWPI
jgi:ATP-binding cassette, subfamily B, multidrug efflux pump